jgi:tRNA threonylcarbamoyladenosine biosynthesis protein TsaB
VARAVIVLAFDTATPATAVALRGAGEDAARVHVPGPGERPGHALAAAAARRGLLDARGCLRRPRPDRRRAPGPGTFTGLRIGVSTARALAQASGAELVGVSTLRALAAPRGPATGPVLAVLDARRGEAFVAALRRRR